MIKIDRERLDELLSKKCSSTLCKDCIGSKINSNISCKVYAIADILEQNPDLITDLPQNTEQIPLPVKTTWTLKPEYLPLYKSITGHIPQSDMSSVPDEVKQFYDCKTDPDYSQVPVGASIEINNFEVQGLVVENNGETIGVRTWNGECCTTYKDLSKLKSLTILKMPEAVK